MHALTHRAAPRDPRRAGGSPFPTSRSAATSKTRSRSTSAISHADCASSVVELSGPPAGVAGEHARARRRACVDSTRRSSAGDVDRYSPSWIVAVLGVLGLSREQDPAALGLDRSADPERQLVAADDRRLQPDHRRRRHVGRAVQRPARTRRPAV